MAQVEFDEQNTDLYQTGYEEAKGAMIKLVESFGVPEEYVNFVLIGVAVVIFIISGLVFYKSTASPRPVLPPSAGPNTSVPGAL